MATLEDLLIKIGIDSTKAEAGAAGLRKHLGKTWDVAKKGAAVGGALVGTALVAGIQSVIESSKPTALLQAQLGATGDFAGKVGQTAGNLFARGVVDSSEEAAATVRAIWQNGLIDENAAQADVDRVAGKLSTLALISEEEAGNVSNAVKQMMRNGLVKNADDAMDLLVRGVQQGVNKAGDLFDTFNEYGTQFRKLGLDGADSMGLMDQAIKAGARDSDTAADALKEFSIRAIDGGAQAAAGYKLLGLSARDMTAQMAKGGPAAKAGLDTVLDRLRAIKDPVKQNAAAVDLFGTKAEDLGKALFAMDVDGAADGLGKVAGAAQAAGDTLENSAGAKLESFKRKALAGLTTELAKMLPAIDATFGFLQRNSSWVEPLAIALGVLAAAIGVITAVQWAWNIAQMASPTTWIILAIVALIAVIVLVATKTRFFQTVWAAVWGFMKTIGAWFAGPFAGFFVALWNKLTASLGRAKAQFMTAFNFIKSLAVGWFNVQVRIVNAVIGAFGRLVGYVRGIPGRIRGALSSMWNGLRSGFASAINWVINRWNSISFTIPSFSVFGHSFGGGTIGVPAIPNLADGALIKARPGGTIARIGEAGQDEAVVPLNRVPELGRSDRPIVIEVVGNETQFRTALRKSLRVRGGEAIA